MVKLLKPLFIAISVFFAGTTLAHSSEPTPPEEGVQVYDYGTNYEKNGQQKPADTRIAFPLPKVNLEMDDQMSPRQLSLGLKLLALLTILTLAPSIMIMMTPFTRIVIVLSFTRRAIGTQSMPSDKMMISLAMFLTIFQMAPIWNEVNEKALTPFMNNQIEYSQALELGLKPFREYMRQATREEDLKVFVKLAQGSKPKNFEEVSTITLIPAFIISEFKTGFQFGVVLFLPFLDRKSTRLNSSHSQQSRMPSSA